MGHILEFLLVPNKFIKLGALGVVHLDRSSLQPSGRHRQDSGLQIGEKTSTRAHKPIVYVSTEARKRFELCLLSLRSS